MGTLISCVGCGGLVPDIEGLTHPYMESSPGCWRVYGEVLAREYNDAALLPARALTPDTFAVQHPGREGRTSTQSVWGHLVKLCLVLERGADPHYAARLMEIVIRNKGRFAWLTPPRSMGPLTVVDVAATRTTDEHNARVRAWAESTWAAWVAHHDTIRGWIAAQERAKTA